jgi:mevalonate kinase
MVCKFYKAVIPGSLMLLGEHAVLHGSRAIVTAIERYITVILTPRPDQIVNINSDLLGKCQFTVPDLKIIFPFQFISAAIAEFLEQLSCGFDLKIKSDFTDKIGLGSSAAVTVATLSVLNKWLNNGNLEPLELVKLGRKVVKKVQGIGSGADVAASVFGKTILYQMEPLNITKLAYNPPLTVVYSGVKTATSRVIQMVEAKRRKNIPLFTSLYAAMDYCVGEAIPAINSRDWPRLGELMNIHQGLQDTLGVNNRVLSELIFSLRDQPDIYGAKISGAGLGDCVIGVGKTKSFFQF